MHVTTVCRSGKDNKRGTYIMDVITQKRADATVYHDFLGFILLVRNKREVYVNAPRDSTSFLSQIK